MDNRFKRPLKQRANYLDAPYHHNPSRGYQRNLHGHPNQGHPTHLHPGKSGRARQHHGYNHGGKSYRKSMPPPPPPPPIHEGGGAMAPPSSGGPVGPGADMVTLIVENNNLKRMIVLHLKLMQEQTDSLAAKDKDLDDQSTKIGVMMALNQELKRAVTKLEAENEDLRKQLRRKNQRRNDDDDDDDDDHLLPPAVPQHKPIRCNAETQTVIREREPSTQTISSLPQQAEAKPRILSVEVIPASTQYAAAITNSPASKRSESKGRGEFNGKKVSTFILQRMNQDSKHPVQEQKDQVAEETKLEEQLQQEDEDQFREEVHHGGEEEQLEMQEVQAEEVVGGDIFHDALESIEMEVVTEELVDLEEQAQSVDANGHMEEDDDDDDEEDQEDTDEANSDEEDNEDDSQSVMSNVDSHSRAEADLWQNQDVKLKKKEMERQVSVELPKTPKEQHKQPDLAKEDHRVTKKNQEVPKEQPKQQEVPTTALKQEDPPKENKLQDRAKDVRIEQHKAAEARKEPVVNRQPEDVPKQLPNAVAPKVAAAPNPMPRETSVLKANTADVKCSPAQKNIANHQSTKTQTDPVKKQRLQVKIRQYDVLSDNRISSSAPSDPRKHKISEPESGPETKLSKHLEEKEEETKHKLMLHIQKVVQSRSHTTPKKVIGERSASNLIYPPPSAPVSSTTITPAPTPSTTPTPGSTPQPTNISSIEPEISAAKSKVSTAAEPIVTPLTPQSNSSVSSSTSTTRKTVNNCSPHTYSRATARSGKTKSIFRTVTFPYSTRTWEDQEFHCDNEFFLEEADELLADYPSLEIPKWRDVPVTPSSDKSNTEPLSDAVFERRHQKYVKDEIDRKYRDARYMREQIKLEGLRTRRKQDEVLVVLDPLPASTFYPLPGDIEAIQFVNEVPLQAYGENIINMEAREDFGVPWVDAAEATTSIARSKALAEPVATLASKKLATTAAEARHQENHSSYVFLKGRKRLKVR
ncbi:protein male-specific lethal-1 isoform X1 [Drosophila ficusphila]|uniref:protein male-specific lethal-1 isoform X1 n=1 Tax=Drosophila ficusphila TaxID=30025 RepID=UPI0007E78F7D|nr:protein male-specific lethal-1 isoform X1 [Drosophila ficusphila]